MTVTVQKTIGLSIVVILFVGLIALFYTMQIRSTPLALGAHGRDSGDIVAEYDNGRFSVYHDVRRNVTCWIQFGPTGNAGAAMICMPDNWWRTQ